VTAKLLVTFCKVFFWGGGRFFMYQFSEPDAVSGADILVIDGHLSWDLYI